LAPYISGISIREILAKSQSVFDDEDEFLQDVMGFLSDTSMQKLEIIRTK
jgi:hypothetical protein